MRIGPARPGSTLIAGALLLTLASPEPAQSSPAQPIPPHPSRLRFPEVTFRVPEAEPHRHLLPNGVPVYIVEDGSLPLVDVAVVVRAGGYLDPPGQVGLASLTAAMLRRGGAGELPPDTFDERADSLALQLDASAGTVRAGVSLNTPSWELPEALDLLFDLLRRPRFDAGRVEAAKGNLRDSMLRRNDDPLAVLEREWNFLLYGTGHLSNRQITPDTLAAITPEALAAFHRRHWHPGGNMVLAISGDVDTDALLADLSRRFAGWEAGEPPPSLPELAAIEPRPGLYHLERDIPQAKVLLGHLGPVRSGWDDRDFYALTVLGEILAGRVGARLRVSEGLAYRAGASIDVGDDWPGSVHIFLETRNETVAPAVKAALEEMERLRREGIRGEELALAKRSLTRVFPLLFDSPAEIAGYFAEDEFLGRPHGFWHDYRPRIEAVTSADVSRVARAFLHPDEVLILTAGQWQRMERGEPGRKVSMDAFYGGLVERLPERDPATLQVPSP